MSLRTLFCTDQLTQLETFLRRLLSVDTVGAFDHFSKGYLLGALLARSALQPLRHFA